MGTPLRFWQSACRSASAHTPDDSIRISKNGTEAICYNVVACDDINANAKCLPSLMGIAKPFEMYILQNE